MRHIREEPTIDDVALQSRRSSSVRIGRALRARPTELRPYTVAMRLLLTLALLLLTPQPGWAWNATGHEVVARIAWDTVTPAVRERVTALLAAAPPDACLIDLLPSDTRPLTIRQREFFERASTWADIVRPAENDPRPCIRFSRGDWHYINYFWQGVSGANGADRPTDRPDVKPPATNILAELPVLRAYAVCKSAQCGTTLPERAVALAWILHLVGDLHQPLHTNARITAQLDEQRGDQGGNLFVLQADPRPLRLHGYWDGILDRSVPRNDRESEAAYVERLAAMITARHPRAAMLARLQSGNYEAWAREGFEMTKASAYPATLKRGELPGDDYRQQAFITAQQAIALAGYRLADLLNKMFGE